MVDVPVILQLPFVAHSTVAVLGRGGCERQVLGGAADAVLAVLDVAVISQRLFGLSCTMEVPQLSSSRRVDISVAQRDSPLTARRIESEALPQCARAQLVTARS